MDRPFSPKRSEVHTGTPNSTSSFEAVQISQNNSHKVPSSVANQS